MPLFEVPAFSPIDAPALKVHLRESGVDRAFVRRMTERLDNLRLPLRPNREASIRDDRDTLLLRLLFCGETMTPDLALEALGPDLLRYAETSGLLVRDNGFRSPFHLRYVRDLLLLSDYLDGHEDAVMGAGETTAILYASAGPHRRMEAGLDLGCGAGTLALLLAADCGHVIGTDINPRAADFGRANAALNGILNIEFRAGDLYEPVAQDRFDLIVSQPPYYPAHHSPHQTFLHGGERGDELAQKVVNGIPQHLNNDGRAIVFTSWPEDRGQSELPGFDILELYSSRNEVSSTRQTLNVFQRGTGEFLQFGVSAESWGYTDSKRLDELFAILRLSDHSLRKTALCLPPGYRMFHEGEQIFLQCPERELIGCVPLSPEEWDALQCVDRGLKIDRQFVRDALRRGLLRIKALV